MNPLTIAGWQISTAIRATRPEDVLIPNQVHGGRVASAADFQVGIPKADGVMTDRTQNIPVGVSTADCLPLVLLGPDQAAVLHVSRKTLITGLLDSLPASFTEQLTHAYVGPHVCVDHFIFEWEGEEIKTFRQQFPDSVKKSENGLHLSLETAVQLYLTQWNICGANVISDSRCTIEATNLPSYKESLAQNRERSADIITSVVLAWQ